MAELGVRLMLGMRFVLTFLFTLVAFAVGLWLGSVAGYSYSEKVDSINNAGAFYIISRSLRENKADDALVASDNSLKATLPAIRDSGSFPFTYLPHTSSARFHEAEFLTYFLKFPPSAMDSHSHEEFLFKTGLHDDPDISSVIHSAQENDADAMTIIDDFRKHKEAEQGAAANP